MGLPVSWSRAPNLGEDPGRVHEVDPTAALRVVACAHRVDHSENLRHSKDGYDVAVDITRAQVHACRSNGRLVP
eukprot:371442-Prorocentrum_minimum.AAC.2